MTPVVVTIRVVQKERRVGAVVMPWRETTAIHLGIPPNRTRSLSTKRPSSDARPGDDAKKPKVEYPPPLVTKAFSSASNLKKPFKTPFKVPSAATNAQESTGVLHVTVEHSEPEPSSSEDLDQVKDQPIEVMVNDFEAMPDVNIVLEESGSSKVDSDARHKGVECIRHALYDAFSTRPQSHIRLPDDARKRQVLESQLLRIACTLTQVAQQLEFLVLSYSSTLDGYKQRIKVKVRAARDLVNALHEKRAHEDEDIQEVLQTIQCVLKS
ncbi:hypothetical protein VNI00_000238 [Paramarasmius palmivorus]|uniref:Uncharacterized protein n=1 Tax=Paramarasmius palmivorus TaxID=297713 RepID=A0AAW0EED0_9AGAR